MRKIAVPVLIAAVMALSSMIIQPQETAYAEEPEPECWAVIIGISNYRWIDDLPGGDNSAEKLYYFLRDIWDEDHIKLLLNDEARKEDILGAMDWLASNADANDTVLLYYAGHGTDGSGGLISPYFAKYKRQWITQHDLNSKMDKLKSEKVVVVLDTCYAGAFAEKLSGSGRIILASCSADEESWFAGDQPTSEFYGVFTYYLLQALDNAFGFFSVDSNYDYELSAEELFAHAESRVVADSSSWGSTQHPFMSDGYSGDIFSDDDSDEIPLLMEVTLSIPANLYYTGFEMDASIDRNTYSSFPAKIVSTPNTEHELQVPCIVDAGNDTRYVFDSWNDGNTSAERTVTHGGEYTADYNKQYHLSIESRYGELEGEGWYDEDSMAAISITSIEEPATKHIFTGWSGDYSGENPVASLTMDSPKEVTANWRTEYLLTIDSAYGEPEGEGWYPKDSSTTIVVMPARGLIIRKVFTGWSGDCSGENPVASLTMDSPKEVTANWRTDYTQLYILIGGSVGAAVAAIVFIRRRRKTTT